MSDANGAPDKNLANVTERLAETPLNSFHAQQLQQKHNDRRHENALNHDQETDREHFKS